MTYEELVSKTKVFYKDADAKAVPEHVAVQFNIEGEAEGAFYVEVSDHKINVEPYEYFDRDAIAYTNAAVLVDVTENKVSFADAVSNGSIHVEGNVIKALLLSDVKISTKKAVAKKTTAKVEAKEAETKATVVAKKATVKAETKKEEVKTIAKKAVAKKEETKPKKAVAKKEEAKPATKKTVAKKETVKAEPAKKTAVKSKIK